MTDSEVAPQRKMHADEIEFEQLLWSRRREIEETGHMLMSHHPPSLYGHCLRVSLRGHSAYFCGRCTGIYGGLVLGILVLSVTNVRLVPSWAWFFAALAVGFATVIDWTTQRLTPRKTTVNTRALTGFMSGLSLAVVFFLADILYMLVTLGVMLGTFGLVGILENRMRSVSLDE